MMMMMIVVVVVQLRAKSFAKSTTSERRARARDPLFRALWPFLRSIFCRFRVRQSVGQSAGLSVRRSVCLSGNKRRQLTTKWRFKRPRKACKLRPPKCIPAIQTSAAQQVSTCQPARVALNSAALRSCGPICVCCPFGPARVNRSRSSGVDTYLCWPLLPALPACKPTGKPASQLTATLSPGSILAPCESHRRRRRRLIDLARPAGLRPRPLAGAPAAA